LRFPKPRALRWNKCSTSWELSTSCQWSVVSCQQWSYPVGLIMDCHPERARRGGRVEGPALVFSGVDSHESHSLFSLFSSRLRLRFRPITVRPFRSLQAGARPPAIHHGHSLADMASARRRPAAPGYADGLRRLVQTRGVDMVHPQPDPEVIAVGALREHLGAMTFLPSQAALETAADKASFAARMARAGVPVPQSTPYSDLSTVVAQTEVMPIR